MKFSLFERHITETSPTNKILIDDFLEILKKENSLIKKIRAIEKIKTSNPNFKQNGSELKKQLGYVTFGGVFSKRSNDSLIKSSGLACLDIDKIEDVQSLKESISKDEYTHLCFVSPSGNGLKVVVKIPEVKDDSGYKGYYNSLTNYFKVECDEKTKDISRACFISYDPDYYFNQNSKVFEKKTETSTKTEVKINLDDDDFIKSIKEKWIEGDRQDLAMSLAGYLRKNKRLGLDSALSIIEGIARDCQDTEVFQRLASVRATYNKDESEIKGISGLKEKEIEPEYNKLEDFLISKGMNNRTGREEFSVDIDRVADWFISRHNVKTWYGKKNDYSFNFDGKIFKQEVRGLSKTESQGLLQKYCRKNISSEIYEKIKTKTKVERDEFEKTDKNYICLENGVWDIKNKCLLPHDPKYNFQMKIPRVYDKTAKCKKWINFLEETLYLEDIPTMQEWFGFLLFREYFLKKGVILVGEQNTGKSVLLDTAIKFIGEKNKSGLSLQKITSGSDFTKLSLKNKHLNAYDDLSSSDLNDGGAFKVATGGGYISGEEKFGEHQEFRSFAKQMFATNKIPPVKDNDDLAYFGRWMIFKLDNVPEKLDTFLRDKLWDEKEMSGILNWALEGLYRILKNGSFSYNKTPEQTKELMEISGCPLVAFSSDVLEREDGNKITKEELFQIYSEWCLENNRPRLTKTGLTKQLPKYCNYVIEGKDKERLWINAKIKPYWDKVSETSVDDEKEQNADNTDTSQDIIYDYNNKDNTGFKKLHIKLKEVSETSVENNDFCSQCNAPMVENKCIGGHS